MGVERHRTMAATACTIAASGGRRELDAATSERSSLFMMAASAAISAVGIGWYLSGSAFTPERVAAIGALVAVLLGFYLVTFPFVRRYGGNAPYSITAPDGQKVVYEQCKLAVAAAAAEKVPRQARMVDLGSGNGEIIVTAAVETGIQADGFELNWVVCYASKLRAYLAGATATAQFYKRDMWTVDLGEYDLIYIWGMPTIMQRFEDKLAKEMKPTARVCVNQFGLPKWKPTSIDNGVHIYKHQPQVK